MSPAVEATTKPTGLEYPVYPIYDVGLAWVEDLPDGKQQSGREKQELWPGRCFNSVSYHPRMFREIPDIGELDNEFRTKVWPKYCKDKKPGNPDKLRVIITFTRYEEWCIGWFQHHTFDISQTDREVLESFENFVRRMQLLNNRERTYHDYIGEDGRKYTMPQGVYPLQGADDRWRWHGAGEDGEAETQTDPPCRCKFCKSEGVIQIGH